MLQSETKKKEGKMGYRKISLEEVNEIPGCAITSKNPQKVSTAACGCYKNEASRSPCGC